MTTTSLSVPRITLYLTMLLTMNLSLATTLRVATFNVSIEADNYDPSSNDGMAVVNQLSSGSNQQIQNIAAIIQTVQPDVLLLNEFDYQPKAHLINLFIRHYLSKPQNPALKAIHYPYFYLAPVNTGVPSGFDLDNDGVSAANKGDAFGYGKYLGQYGMVILSKYPIDVDQVRTFQHFLWRDMPDAQLPTSAEHLPWFDAEELAVMRLSSKSHWDVPIDVLGKKIHVLAAHPTPPVFDGPEDRNGKRNHDEIRLWSDYISN